MSANFGQKTPGDINSHKQMAMDGAPSMGSLKGEAYAHSPSAPMADAQRAHKGPTGKPSMAADVDHGHKWGKK